MKKRGIALLVLILSIQFLSATGIGDVLDSFNSEDIVLVATILISFALINVILGKVPIFTDRLTGKKNKATPGVIAFVISLLIAYGVNEYDFDLSNFFFQFGIEQDLLMSLAAIAIIVGIIYLLWKYKAKTILIGGLLLIGFSLTEIAYESDKVLIAGIVLIVIWLAIKLSKRESSGGKDRENRISDLEQIEKIQSAEKQHVQKIMHTLREKQKIFSQKYVQYQEKVEEVRKLQAKGKANPNKLRKLGKEARKINEFLVKLEKEIKELKFVLHRIS